MGATGIVYKAELQRPHTTVAVKKLWRSDNSNIVDVDSDIAGEVTVLGKLRHRNITSGGVPRAHQGTPNPDYWVSLRKCGSAGISPRGSLTSNCHPPIIHRDIKSNNILLDGNLEARIADFGLARMMMRKNETVSMVAGSYGYIAPEYGYTLKVDQKSDIYSFGVVLMELVTGRRPVEPEYGESQDIVGWVRDKLRDNRGVEGVLDLSTGGQTKHTQEEMVLVLRIAVLCTAKLPKDRPTMRDVVSMLGEAKPRRKSSSAAGSGGC
ncbi:uncharacterized protein A4U43_C07F19360 [Asparagus officinalis]|uniref:Protein kinase domain-containing protein n=1 Tax=Asparagus officinalis TaxID=4686 RepID=A0A5P1ED73_ASPOF|nr:uncharacterized protein A4U43_C07F19360 [Asparagus officinalis]